METQGQPKKEVESAKDKAVKKAKNKLYSGQVCFKWPYTKDKSQPDPQD